MNAITPTDLNTKITAGENPYILDVREDDEVLTSILPTATHMPMATVADNMDTLPNNQPIYVICRSGRRSQSITDMLIGAGHDAHNITGGMQAWQAEVAPDMPVA